MFQVLLKGVAAWSVETYTNVSNGLMHFCSGSDLWNISFAAAPAAAFAKLRATNLVNVDTMSGSGAVIDSCVFSVTQPRQDQDERHQSDQYNDVAGVRAEHGNQSGSRARF